MIPKECKRIAEVDFPIADVSKHAIREKSIRRGHPSTLHLWWARRPLASSRAVTLALLLPDPCDKHCPKLFKEKARYILLGMKGRPREWTTKIKSDEGLRQILLMFISSFADWDNATNSNYFDVSRALVKMAHPTEPPLVVDPFAGGGSIPLEAARLGCEVFASDLNPVACLILKVVLENIPRYREQLANELHAAGSKIKSSVEAELSELYPKDPDGSTPIAYLWARTVRCESPTCGAEIPLLRSFWLCNSTKRKYALQYRIEHFENGSPSIRFEIFQPKSDKEVPEGTVSHAKATCLCCGVVLPANRVRAQLFAQRGGTDIIFDAQGHRKGGASLVSVVTIASGCTKRQYRLPIECDYIAVQRAQERMNLILKEWRTGDTSNPCPIPDEPLPLMSGTFNVPLYGIKTWGDLFTTRQKIVLAEIVRQIRFSEISDVLKELVMCAFGVFARSCNGNARLRPDSSVAPAFGMHALPITWAFPETVISGGRSEHFDGALSNIVKIVERFPVLSAGQVQQADATDYPLPDQSVDIWFTDPPYYFAVPYADLSDFFFVWLKRALPNHPLLRDPFNLDNPLTPKEPELCEMAHWDSERYSHKNQIFFEDGMAKAFTEGRRVLREDGVASVVFAHKTTEGWEALLSGMIRGGWTITGSWPIATENKTRLRARDSAALATSVHLICRPRSEDAQIGDWANVLRELPIRVSTWMERLQSEDIRGADLVFACIGPALEVFSRYRAVETAEGRKIGLPEYLEKVWEVVGRTALQQILGTAGTQVHNDLSGALEEDARLTALFLWTFQSTVTSQENSKKNEETVIKASNGFSLPFDVVRRFAQPMGIDLDLWTNRIIGQTKGIVRLLPVTERTRDLFGDNGVGAAADWIENEPSAGLQTMLFPELNVTTKARNRHQRKTMLDEDIELQAANATTLDRLHATMLLQANGHANALRTLISTEQERGPEFLQLANALSALYPRNSQEKRLLDAMLLTVPR